MYVQDLASGSTDRILLVMGELKYRNLKDLRQNLSDESFSAEQAKVRYTVKVDGVQIVVHPQWPAVGMEKKTLMVAGATSTPLQQGGTIVAFAPVHDVSSVDPEVDAAGILEHGASGAGSGVDASGFCASFNRKEQLNTPSNMSGVTNTDSGPPTGMRPPWNMDLDQTPEGREPEVDSKTLARLTNQARRLQRDERQRQEANTDGIIEPFMVQITSLKAKLKSAETEKEDAVSKLTAALEENGKLKLVLAIQMCVRSGHGSVEELLSCFEA